MDNAPPSLEMRMVDARTAGRDAALAELPRNSPWRADAATAVERTLSMMWARGYSEGNPVVLPDDLESADA